MERKKDKSRSVLLIRLFARPAALWWETGGGSGAAAAISLTPSRDWCVIEGLCEIMSISSRSSVPLGLASVTHQDFLKNCQSSNNAPLILWLLLLSHGLDDAPSEVALQVTDSSSPGFSLLLYQP